VGVISESDSEVVLSSGCGKQNGVGVVTESGDEDTVAASASGETSNSKDLVRSG